MTTTSKELPVLPQLEDQNFDELSENLAGKFVFEWLEDKKLCTRYGVYYSQAHTAHLSADRIGDLNESLPDAYVCNECGIIDGDIEEYGCSSCGNGA